MSIFGPTLSAWAAALLYVALKPFKAGEPWAWHCMAVSLAIWFVPDTVFSVTNGIWTNVLFIMVGFIMVALPLAFTRKAFVKCGGKSGESR